MYLLHSTKNFDKIQPLLISKNYPYSYLRTAMIKTVYIINTKGKNVSTKIHPPVSYTPPANSSKTEDNLSGKSFL